MSVVIRERVRSTRFTVVSRRHLSARIDETMPVLDRKRRRRDVSILCDVRYPRGGRAARSGRQQIATRSSQGVS